MAEADWTRAQAHMMWLFGTLVERATCLLAVRLRVFYLHTCRQVMARKQTQVLDLQNKAARIRQARMTKAAEGVSGKAAARGLDNCLVVIHYRGHILATLSIYRSSRNKDAPGLISVTCLSTFSQTTVVTVTDL